MKRIIKVASHIDFEQWKTNNQKTIDSMFVAGKSGNELWNYFKSTANQVFKDTRNQILNEQSHLCAYCNRKIHDDASRKNDDRYTTIDHVVAKSKDPTRLTFEYANLIASCDGARKDPRPRDLHCDALKDSKAILVSPLQPDCEDLIFYTSNGDIFGISDSITDNLKMVLGLNCPKLKNERKNSIEGFIEDPNSPDGLIDEETAKELLSKIDTNLEYSSAIVSVLKRELLSK